MKSCAHWLSWKCGIGLVAGREHVRIARALVDLPRTRAELSAGRLSYSKVRALTRVATPATEADLVEIALSCTGAQLDRLAAGLRRAGSLDEVNARHERRSLSWSWAEDGSLVLKGRFAPEDGALIVAALEAARDTGDASAEESEDPEHGPGQYPKRITGQANADAMVVLAETLLASGPAPAPGGARHQVNLHSDLDALVDDAVAARKPPRIENGPDLHPETLRRLCCDSGAVIVAHHDRHRHEQSAGGRRRGTWMDVGRRTRTVSASLRRALVLRDGGCRFPGCTETRFVDAHHVIFWTRGGPTALWNLILICRRHHRYVHEGGFRITTDGAGGFHFQRPDGQAIPEFCPASGGAAEKIGGMHRAEITPTTTTPHWDGERLDLPYAVSVLTQSSAAPSTDPTLN